MEGRLQNRIVKTEGGGTKEWKELRALIQRPPRGVVRLAVILPAHLSPPSSPFAEPCPARRTMIKAGEP
jgi:hypothetical protein